MTIPPARRSLSALFLACSLAALLALAAVPALARKGACASSSHASHSRRAARACAQSRHARKSHRRRTRERRGTGSGRRAGAPAPAARVAPICEGGATPLSGPGGLTCSDGAEPSCPANTTPTVSASGAILYCTPHAEAGTEFNSEGACESGSSSDCEVAAAACEAGKAPILTGSGTYACTDESEPRCPDGSTPTLAEDTTTLVCPVDLAGETAG